MSKNTSDGPVALVVGASRGAGRAIALRLAREGHRVLALGRDRDRLDRLAETPNIVPVVADLRDRAACMESLERVANDYPDPTVLVHCAATLYRHQRLHTIDSLETAELLQVDLLSAVYLTQWALERMSRARTGRIVYLGSLAASQGHPGATLYSTAKAGLEGLCRGVALDYGARGITANTIALGVLDAERLQQRTDDDGRAALLRRIPTGSFIALDDVAELVWYLCGPFASQITGSVIPLNGGAHLRTS